MSAEGKGWNGERRRDEGGKCHDRGRRQVAGMGEEERQIYCVLGGISLEYCGAHTAGI